MKGNKEESFMDYEFWRKNIHKVLLDLSTEEGINASSKNEIYGCIFGRDSALTILKILKVHKKRQSPDLLEISKRTLLTLVSLQGKAFNLESGEEPGKFIHEFRKENYGHLKNAKKPWFIYPDGVLRNYDSIDSTPLTLIAIYRYWELSLDNDFLEKVLPSVKSGLNWIIDFSDKNKDFLVEYEFNESRRFGGLVVQSWTDSHESIMDQYGNIPKYPIAPVEVQSYVWLALRLWSDFYQNQDPVFSKKLNERSRKIKEMFNQKFIIKDKNLFFAAQAIDGNKNQMKTITGNPMLLFWSFYKNETILEEKYVEDFVKRAFLPDMFVENAGIRTMSSESPTFNPNQDSYHNGSFWPVLNGLIVEGLENFNFKKEALRLKEASLYPLKHFNTPIELYIKTEDSYCEYCSPSGQLGCRQQAWSAAAFLDLLTN